MTVVYVQIFHTIVWMFNVTRQNHGHDRVYQVILNDLMIGHSPLDILVKIY
jgi:hypothetical protein